MRELQAQQSKEISEKEEQKSMRSFEVSLFFSFSKPTAGKYKI